jgi:hypothetical protein
VLPAGGPGGALAHTYGDYLSQKLDQPVIVENRAGATGRVGALAVKRSPPDGYTPLIAIHATFAQNRVPHLPPRLFLAQLCCGTSIGRAAPASSMASTRAAAGSGGLSRERHSGGGRETIARLSDDRCICYASAAT